MKKITNKLIMLLAVLMLMTVCFAFGASAETWGDYEYTVREDGTVRIVEYNGTDSKITLPSEIDGKRVTSIASYGFDSGEVITSITIPESIDSGIDEYTFKYCGKLESIFVDIGNASYSSDEYGVLFNKEKTELIVYPTKNKNESYVIPDTVTVVRSFSGNDYLKKIEIPNGVETLNYSAFNGCAALENVIIPDSVTAINQSCFSGCTNLQSVVIGNGATLIGQQAFESCENLETVTIGENVSVIGTWAFANCAKLTSITFPAKVSLLGNDFVEGCTALTNIFVHESNKYYASDEFGVLFDKEKTELLLYPKGSLLKSYTVPNSVKEISTAAFKDSLYIEEIIVQDGVTEIGNYAFYNCSSLKSITLPDSVTDMGSYVFDGSEYYEEPLNWQNNILYVSNHLIKADENVSGDIIIKDGTKTIAGNAFVYCENLSSVYIPDSVILIGERAFVACESLKSVRLPKYITELSDYIIYHCESLDSIIIPDGVRKIGTGAFAECSTLESIVIPDDVTEIGGYSFRGTAYAAKEDNWDNGVLYLGKYAIGVDSEIVECEIKEGTEVIAGSMFRSCRNLEVVKFPSTLTYVGSNVSVIWDALFYNCPNFKEIHVPNVETWVNLKFASISETPLYNNGVNLYIDGEFAENVIIPDGIDSIGQYAFYKCKSLLSVNIPDSVTSIGSFAFYGCTGLTSITIPDSVTSIESFAFSGCTGLTSVYITDIASWCNIDFNDPTSTPFYYAKNLYLNGELVIDLIIPDGVTSIGSFAFYGCTGLTSVTIPDSVTSIGSFAFSGCTDLTSVTIPEGVTSIGSFAFSGCTSLTSVTVPDSVTSIDNYAFYRCTGLESITISNPDCVIYDSDDTIYEGAIIYGYDGSTAQAYAEKYGRTFKTLEKAIVDDLTKIEANFKGDCFSKDVTMVIDETAVNANYVFGSLFDLFKSYNIYFEADGEKVQPDGYVTIKIPLPDGYNAETTAVYYVATDGTKEKIDSTYEDGYIVFETNHFSEYVLVDESSIHTHSYSSSVTKDATCTENGVVTYTCSCSDAYTETIEATGHIFDDDDENCQLCGFDRTDDCDCNCHKGGIAKFFFNIILFFQKLFRINGECSCGIAHY